jgi:hypothetical protein
VQPVYEAIEREVAGLAPSGAHSLSATTVPSDWVQVTLRVSVVEDEQLETGAPHSPMVQVYEQVLVSLKDWESALSVPQL